MNNYIIRYSNLDDYKGVCSIINNIFKFVISKNNYDAYLSNENNNILVAEIDNKVVGVACFEKIYDVLRDTNTLFIRYAGVLEPYRRQGIYREMQKIIKEKAITQNIRTIELTCGNFRVDAHNFYLKNGFKKKATTVFIREW